ncbi:FixH family protein [Aureibaculum conchae]|uniref:FixH family protein n=1 Tax=Aureibaculum sp. 2308TA14-22 TaxID=3108392 RepID=UPI0033944289
MRIKINWGWAMVIVMAAFMIFILQFVYRSLADDTLEHHLVSEDYYKDELYYQQEIDKMNNASKLSQNVKVEKAGRGMLVTFPDTMDLEKIKGTIYFQRPSDKRIDFKREIVLNENTMLIEDDKLINGRWNIKIDWKFEDEEYLFKKDIFY